MQDEGLDDAAKDSSSILYKLPLTLRLDMVLGSWLIPRKTVTRLLVRKVASVHQASSGKSATRTGGWEEGKKVLPTTRVPCSVVMIVTYHPTPLIHWRPKMGLVLKQSVPVQACHHREKG